jgi:hypothetical protein
LASRRDNLLSIGYPQGSPDYPPQNALALWNIGEA